MTKKQFSALVRKRRKELDMSLTDFAAKVGVSWITIYRWEKSTSAPTDSTIEFWVSKVSE